ncbi:MAG: MFS transporter [Spirochaetales bacterium]|nr:MFS transporter [Spirochaetales bacterium]
MKKGFGKYAGVTFLIGFGFFTMGMMDPLYDTYIPIFLKKFIESKALIGTIMTLDNIFAVFLIPIVTVLSDRTGTKIGRRMPYILITLPLTAIMFALTPFTALSSLALLIVAIFLLNVFKQAARGPVVALMPDTIPGEYRSEANGVINTMGGIAAIVGTLGLAILMNVKINIPGIGLTDNILAYPAAGVFVLLATLILFLFVKEKHKADPEKREPVLKSLKMVLGASDKSAVLILLALFFWFLGYQGILPFVGTYSEEVLGVSHGLAAFAAGMVAIAYALMAIPSGIMAHKVGRKKMISLSLMVIVVILVILSLLNPIVSGLGFGVSGKMIMFFAFMFVFGMFWVTIVTNSFPMLWQMATFENVGIYTGLYYTFSQLAAIVAPPISGAIIDLTGYPGMYIFAAVCMLVAFLIMRGVKKGEAGETQEEASV